MSALFFVPAELPHYSASESFVENIPVVHDDLRMVCYYLQHSLLPLNLSRNKLQRSDV